MPIWTVCTRALSWSKGILTHSGLLTIYNLIIILSSKACSTDRADAAVRQSRSRLLHAAKRWVSRPDNARVASLRGDAGTQPLVHFYCPLWETSRRWLSGSRKVGFLHHILGIHCAAKHAVGDAKEVGAVAFKILCW